MSGAVTNETPAKNYYKFAAFKGTYKFDKHLDADTEVRIVAYTEQDDILMVNIKKDDEVVYTLEVCKDKNGTYYVDLTKGNYVFSFSSTVTYKAELTFGWKGDE